MKKSQVQILHLGFFYVENKLPMPSQPQRSLF